MRYYISIYRLFVVQYIKTLMQSKLNFFIGFLGCLFVQISGIIFLYLIFNNIPLLNGWSINQLVFIYGFSQIPRGIDHFFTDYIWLLASRMVTNGEFDRYLLRPINPLFQLLFDRVQLDAIGELLIGGFLVAMSIKNGTVYISLINILLFIISILSGAVIYTSIKLFFASLAFWMTNSSPILQLGYEVSDFAKYPISIYSKPIQIFISFIIPFAFVAFYPASYFITGKNVLITIGAEVGVAIIFWTISYSIFKRGVNAYKSVGN